MTSPFLLLMEFIYFCCDENDLKVLRACLACCSLFFFQQKVRLEYCLHYNKFISHLQIYGLLLCMDKPYGVIRNESVACIECYLSLYFFSDVKMLLPLRCSEHSWLLYVQGYCVGVWWLLRGLQSSGCAQIVFFKGCMGIWWAMLETTLVLSTGRGMQCLKWHRMYL